MPFSFLITDLYFLINADIVLAFNVIAELVIPTGKLINKAKAAIETHPMIAQTNLSNCSMCFKFIQTFFMFLTH